MKSKRTYVKKNKLYWTSVASKKKGVLQEASDYKPEILGEPFYQSKATEYSRNSQIVRNRTQRTNVGSKSPIDEAYSNIEAYSVPFSYGSNGTSDIKEPIELCQKAYFHVPVFKNTVDMLSELSDSSIVLSGGTKAARAFVKKWMDSIKIEGIKSQFFREYYRSGNVFLYRIFAKFTEEELSSMKTIYAQNYELIPQDSGFPKNSLPMRYILLNPMDIVNYESIGSSPVYKKVLTKFETTKLKNPTTEEEKRILERIRIENGGKGISEFSNEVYLNLEPKSLVFVFYKKQDYEPFAVPFGFPVLRDINWKLELKKVDQSVSRILENIILLITMGNDPDKGGINPRNLEAMKELFGSEAVGRVLVADYTTKAQFIIPEVGNILGPEKYSIVNQDIKDGLQNIFFEEAKYSNSEIKVKVFFEKLKEGKKAFIENFLQPEIKKVCAALGFREFPTARFKSSTILNESETQKTALRLMELGIIPPKQGVESINVKELPDAADIGEGQEEYRKQRESGQYVPLVGGPPLYAPETDAAKAAQKAKVNTGAPVKVPTGARGRPSSKSIAKEDSVSVMAVADVARKASKLESFAKEAMKKAKNLKTLSEEQDSAVKALCNSIVESCESCEWEKVFSECATSMASIDKLNIKPEILEIANEFDINTYQAALIYHSRKA